MYIRYDTSCPYMEENLHVQLKPSLLHWQTSTTPGLKRSPFLFDSFILSPQVFFLCDSLILSPWGLFFFFQCIQTETFEILLDQTKIRFYLPFSNLFGTKRTSVGFQINRKMVNTIWLQFDWIRFRRDFSECS